MKILLTGANGFIGKRVITRLMPHHEIYALVRGGAHLPDGVHAVEADLSQPLPLESLPSRVDAVIHLAQSRHYRSFPDAAPDIFRVNAASTVELLEFARSAGASTFLYASSGGVCGFREAPITEADPPAPGSFYLLSKHVGEQVLMSYAPYFNIVALRLFFPYGEGQSNMMMPTLIERIGRGEPITLNGPDGIRLNPTYVGDVAEAIERALTLSGSHTLNVAGPDVVSFRELVQTIATLLGHAPTFSHETATEGNLVGDTSCLTSTLGWQPTTLLRDGLRAMISARSAGPG